MAEYWESNELKALAESLIAAHHPHLASAKIGYLFRDKAQRKKLSLDKDGPTQVVRGNTSRVSAGKYDPFIDKDFILEIPYDEWQNWTSSQRSFAVDTYLCTLMGDEDDANGGDMKWFMLPFQVCLFPDVVRRWGLPFDEELEAARIMREALDKRTKTLSANPTADPSAEDAGDDALVDPEVAADEEVTDTIVTGVVAAVSTADGTVAVTREDGTTDTVVAPKAGDIDEDYDVLEDLGL